VNFNWGTDQLIPDIASNYVSIVWEGYIKPLYSESYTFSTESNDGLRVFVNGELLIDDLTDSSSDADNHIHSSSPMAFTSGQLYQIKVQYYDLTGTVFVSLSWESTSQVKEVVPASSLYYKASTVPIGGAPSVVEAQATPRTPTGLEQSGTFSTTALTISWTPPADTGCLAITDYKIQTYDGSNWVDSVTGIATTSGTVGSLTPGTLSQLRVVAQNALGFGTESSSISLIPATLPVAPASITVTSYGTNHLDLQWPTPVDTGIGDMVSIPIDNYLLEVDEGFGNGFEALSEQTTKTFSHTYLILGHSYTYRVSA